MKKLLVLFLLFSLVLSACRTQAPVSTPTATYSLPEPSVNIQAAPDVESSARQYLDELKNEEYAAMYARLSVLSKDAITEEDFTATHKQAARNLTMQSLDYSILSSMVNPTTAQVAYEISYESALLDTIVRKTLMNLILENDAWHIQWEEGMILPELSGGNYLELVLEVPARGNIYSSTGYPMVAQEDAVTLLVVPGNIDSETEGSMVSLLAEMLDVSGDTVRDKYEFTPADQYAVIGNVTAAVADEYYDRITRFSGISLSPYKSRYYYDGGIAPHVTGYVLSISPEQLEEYQRKGYTGDEKIGASGLEAWGESYLAGKHGADLYVKDPQGQILTKIGDSDAEPASSIYTTIDSAYQYKLQQSLGNELGAIVVMEVDTGKVIAMASNPPFDPNVFISPSYSYYSVNEVIGDPFQPMYNRAAQGVYPPGSVFKMVTMAAGLETGVFTPEYPYVCDSLWTELEGWVGKDWTYDKGFESSGLLTLKEGLMRSCNPWFWHIGYTLWNDGYTTAIYDLAKGFGLGQPTGIEIPDFAGNLIQPESISENVQMSIGQGTLQVSPLQIANYVAAIANGGTLYRPTLIERIAFMDSEPVYSFEPQVLAKLPVTEENLLAIQEGMRMVLRNPSGTAYYQFRNFDGNIAGKTGTAENPLGDSHAWFGGYTYNNDPNKPDIAVAIILENAGEGSEMAAPLFRRAVALYFSNGSNSGGTMPWEESPYIVATPEPDDQ